MTSPWYLRVILHAMQVIVTCSLSGISTLYKTYIAKPREGSDKLYDHCRQLIGVVICYINVVWLVQMDTIMVVSNSTKTTRREEGTPS